MKTRKRVILAIAQLTECSDFVMFYRQIEAFMTVQDEAEIAPFTATIERFRPFRERHPQSHLEMEPRAGGDSLMITRPWNDTSLEIIVPDNPNELADALNMVYLPERFSALWHRDTHDLEVIYTAFTIHKEISPSGRKFTFRYNGCVYECEFGRSSERLMEIARHARPVSDSATNHRNLVSFWIYTEHLKAQEAGTKQAPPIPVGEPLSFWIRNLQCEDNDLVSLAMVTNFRTYHPNEGRQL